jgi:hypothetical protein
MVIQARVIDTTHLELLKPIDLPEGAHVSVSLADADLDNEHAQWLAVSQEALQAAYGDDEPEYSLDLLREANPEFDA